MSGSNHQVRLPAWSPLPEPHGATLPEWDSLPGYNRAWTPQPEDPVFTVQLHAGEAIIDLFDMLQDTEFEDMLSRLHSNSVAIRRLEKEIQKARLLERETRAARVKFQGKEADQESSSRSFWDFRDLSHPGGLASYEIRVANRARENIEAISPKATHG